MTVTLGELVASGAIELRPGYAHGGHNEAGKGIPHLRPFNVSEDGRIDLSKIKWVPAPEPDSPHWLHRCDVVFNNTNSEKLTGKTAFFDLDLQCTASNHMTIVRVTDTSVIDAYFLSSHLRYLFTSGFFRTLLRRYVGQASVSLTRLGEVEVPLPPVPEQRAIAHVLRTVQKAREATEQVIDAARELKRSLMRHLFTYGPVSVSDSDRVELQEVEFGTFRADWSASAIEDLALVKGGKRLPKGHGFASDVTPYPYVRVVDFADGSVDQSEMKFLTEEDHEQLSRSVIRLDDVYISIAGTTGLVGRVPAELDGANLTENAAKLVITEPGVTADYLWRVLDSHIGQTQVAEKTIKSTQPKLALSRIRTIEVPLPDLHSQDEITDLLGAVDAKVAAEAQQLEALDALFSSLLAKLMSGRLRVPESMWEPAA